MDRGLYGNIESTVFEGSTRDKIAVVILLVHIEVDVRGMEQPVVSHTEALQLRSLQRGAKRAGQLGAAFAGSKLFN